MAHHRRTVFFICLIWAFLIHAVISDVCSTLANLTTIDMSYPLSLSYATEQSTYWSTSCSLLKPSCIILPQTTEEVITVVSALRAHKEPFAIKSGGHNPNNNFASVDGGPLISTKNLNRKILLDPKSRTARVGPGNRWDDVAKALDGTGLSAVGGRIGDVGVGGFLLGGGLSFMSTEHGWAANSVLEYELVLANASAVTVTADSHPDLFLSLKGGGNALGIVTSFLLQVYPQEEKIWGGTYTFDATPATATKLLAAVRDFTTDYPDPKAGIILTRETTAIGTVQIWILFVYYNGREPPAGVFDKFTAVGPLLSTCKTQSMASLLTANNFANVKGNAFTIGTETIPLPRGDEDAGLRLLEEVLDNWQNVTSGVLGVTGLISSIAFQPIPRAMTQIARAKGGDLYDLDDDTDRIVLENNYAYTLPVDRNTIDSAMQRTYQGVRELVERGTQAGILTERYLPLFMNDGYYRQDYFGRLRPEMAQLARRVRDGVDPEGLWKDRTGGFKL
ncbi:uncharacterized protein E0L32_002184 [Thyridium curvatum]|uniref:FAD-binding PCMH-type domain-containing protein n=1 Tax=Thyridium curvatum TaxID=1093900 RepID=A0A507APD8_9PEZI|nr:uncharacterized protein E0L32_002184 [Thyridium curvatum]TPX06688.1 hypothetical protein E0L32_002184 [Thyridium curvatum]